MTYCILYNTFNSTYEYIVYILLAPATLNTYYLVSIVYYLASISYYLVSISYYLGALVPALSRCPSTCLRVYDGIIYYLE